MTAALFEKGWQGFPADPAIAGWIEGSLPAARLAVADPANAKWRRYGGTWFVGVNCLPNDDTGAVPGGLPLSGTAIDFIGSSLGQSPLAWDRAQLSVCYPGYPQPMAGETEAAFRFRRDRDAAHVDGLTRAAGPDKRRNLGEPHAFVFGIPMTAVGAGASPLVVWESSHEIMRRAFLAAFGNRPPERWRDLDIAAAYDAARRQVFAACRRVEVVARPGETYLLHRLVVHGVSPWKEGAMAGPDGRMIAYFRPALKNVADWLGAP